MWNISDKSCRGNQNMYYVFSNFFFWKSCHLWDKVEKYGRPIQATDDSVIWHLRFACWITKATDTHTQYVTLTAFFWHIGASMLHYTYAACLVSILCATHQKRTWQSCLHWPSLGWFTITFTATYFDDLLHSLFRS